MFTDYRFLTEREFIEKYGEDWRAKVPGGWDKRMDIYIGKPIEPKQYKICRIGGVFTVYTNEKQHSWLIFNTMYREYDKYLESIEQLVL